MKLTTFGIASGTDEVACYRSRSGALLEAYSYDQLDPTLPDAGVPVDLDHNPDHVVGSMVYGEVAPNGALGVVCVLDSDELTRLDEPVYFSPVLTQTGALHRSFNIAATAWLDSLALTLSTARLAAQPVQWLAGDIRDAGDRARWPGYWRHDHTLLARAVDALDGRRRMPTLVRRAVASPEPDGYGHGWVDYDGRPATPVGGAMRYSTPVPGSILGVR